MQWLEEGEATRYVGIPLGFKISQDKKDAVALVFVSKHLNFWTSKQCSLAGIFINAIQAIEASLWFISRCVDISYKTLKKIIGLIGNYIWSGDAYHNARAKVAWKTLILSHSLGGVKILDPLNMSFALLSKFIIKGLDPTKSPWKTFLLYHINNLEPSNSKNWPKGKLWIFSATNIKSQDSPLWEVIWKPWCLVRKDIIPLQPKKIDEFLKQPFFGNLRFTNENNLPWELEPHSRWSTWAKNGIIGDLWNTQEKRWLNIREIKLIIKSFLVDQHRDLLLSSLPQNLETIQLEDIHFTIGELLLSKEDIQPHFLILTTKKSIGIPFGLLFIQLSTYNWTPYDFIERQAPHSNFHRVKVSPNPFQREKLLILILLHIQI